MIIAIIRYDVDSVLNLGRTRHSARIGRGHNGNIFFHRDQVEQTGSRLRTTQAALRASDSEKSELGEKVQQLAHQVKAFSSANSQQEHVATLLDDVGKK